MTEELADRAQGVVYVERTRGASRISHVGLSAVPRAFSSLLPLDSLFSGGLLDEGPERHTTLQFRAGCRNVHSPRRERRLTCQTQTSKTAYSHVQAKESHEWRTKMKIKQQHKNLPSPVDTHWFMLCSRFPLCRFFGCVGGFPHS